MNTWLLVDINYLAHRAKHSTGDMSHEGISTGVAFGVLRDLKDLAERFNPYRMVLALDYRGRKIRQDMLPSYKSSREAKKTEEDRERDVIFRQEVTRLWEDLLPRVGYRNLVEREGYEADDVLAGYAAKIPKGHDAIIVTGDEDLWQCLSPVVMWYSPGTGRLLDSQTFYQEWGVDPIQWAHVKALAGCKTDDVPGIPGIGEKSAAGWFNGKLKAGSKKWELISENIGIIQQNLSLVKLPLPGLRLPAPVPDSLSDDGWQSVLVELGIMKLRQSKNPKIVSAANLF